MWRRRLFDDYYYSAFHVSTNHMYFFLSHYYYDRKSHTTKIDFISFHFILLFLPARLVLCRCIGWCVCVSGLPIWFNNALNIRNICVDCIIYGPHERTNERLDNETRWLQWHMTAVLVCVVPLYKFDFRIREGNVSANQTPVAQYILIRLRKGDIALEGVREEEIPEIRCRYVAKMFICSLHTRVRVHIKLNLFHGNKRNLTQMSDT